VIVHGGKDYYDSVLFFGRDETLHYVRNEQKEPLKIDETPFVDLLKDEITIGVCKKKKKNNKYTIRSISFKSIVKDDIYVTKFFVYFAGKIYPGLVFYEWRVNPKKIFVYSKEEAERVIETTSKNKDVEIYVDKRDNDGGWRRQRMDLDEFFSIKLSNEVIERLIAHKIGNAIIMNDKYPTSYFANQNDLMVLYDSDKLKEVEFYKVKSPAQAFQELSQYVSNLPKDGPKMIEIKDDKIIASKKGFDEWSFRKKGQKKGS